MASSSLNVVLLNENISSRFNKHDTDTQEIHRLPKSDMYLQSKIWGDRAAYLVCSYNITLYKCFIW